jgi:hypothetical protein
MLILRNPGISKKMADFRNLELTVLHERDTRILYRSRQNRGCFHIRHSFSHSA